MKSTYTLKIETNGNLCGNCGFLGSVQCLLFMQEFDHEQPSGKPKRCSLCNGAEMHAALDMIYGGEKH